MKTKQRGRHKHKPKQRLTPQDHIVIKEAKRRGMYVMVTRVDHEWLGTPIYTFFSLKTGIQMATCTNEKSWKEAIDRAVSRMQS